MMFTTITAPGLSSNRLDPTYYRPEHVRDSSLMSKWSREQLDDLRRADAPIVYGVLKPDDKGRQHRVAKAERFDGMFVWAEDCDPISEEMFHEFRRAEALDGDLLVAIGGYVGRPAIVRAGAGLRLVVNRHLARVRIDESHCDRYWALAYFSSSLGERQLTREITGSVQAGINLCDLRLVQVPLPDRRVQRYIGDKVRQAEQLRERARRLEQSFRTAVAPPAIPPESLKASKTSRVVPDELGRNLNPGAHTPYRRAVRTALQEHGARRLDELAEIASPTSDAFGPRTAYVGLDAIDSATCKLSPSTVEAEGLAGTARLLCEGPAISKLRPYLNKVAYIPADLAGAAGSTELLLVRPRTGVDGWFLYGILKLESTMDQLNPVATGSTHPRVDREDVLELLVPWRDAQSELGAMLRRAQGSYLASGLLVAAAKRLVEQLIKGTISENDLVAAQQALESGNRAADRTILQKLRQSDEENAAPLFADLDGLFDLLDAGDDRGSD